MTRCVGIRGATTVDEDDLDEVLDATQDLLERLRELNGFDPDELASIIFTTTADLRSTFPARAARRLGWTQVPMMCAQEIDAPSSVQRCVRVMIHWNTDKTLREVRHAYLRGSRLLRPDWATPPLGGPGGHLTAPERPLEEAEQAASDRAQAARAEPAIAEAIAAPAPAEPRQLEITPLAVLGEPGSYSQQAAFGAFGRDALIAPGKTFRQVFEAVHHGRAKAALVPIENSTAGSVHEVYDLLLSQDLRIVGEVILPVRHVLMARPGAALADVRAVMSHPQALRQCHGWISNHGWQTRSAPDTASAAAAVAASEEPGLAAIASPIAAELRGLEVLARGIQDVSENFTRFWLLAPAHGVTPGAVAPGLVDPQAPPRPTKTSLIFATRHTAGNLYACLAEFAVRDVNLTKIQSRPDKRTPWNYLFYLDFEGDAGDPRIAQALRGVQRHASFLRVLGSYPTRLL